LIVTIFRSRLRKEYIKEYSEVAERMERLAKEMPDSDGFPFKTFGNDENVMKIEIITTGDELMSGLTKDGNFR